MSATLILFVASAINSPLTLPGFRKRSRRFFMSFLCGLFRKGRRRDMVNEAAGAAAAVAAGQLAVLTGEMARERVAQEIAIVFAENRQVPLEGHASYVDSRPASNTTRTPAAQRCAFFSFKELFIAADHLTFRLTEQIHEYDYMCSCSALPKASTPTSREQPANLQHSPLAPSASCPPAPPSYESLDRASRSNYQWYSYNDSGIH